MADEVPDEQRFTAIYEECRQRVWAYATARAGRQIADEVVSETFAVAWRRLADVPDPALPWLLGVARNVLRDGHRAQVRREAFAHELGRWAPRASGDIAEDVAERLAVLRAMADLPEGTGRSSSSSPGRAWRRGTPPGSSAARRRRCGCGCTAPAAGSPARPGRPRGNRRRAGPGRVRRWG